MQFIEVGVVREAENISHHCVQTALLGCFPNFLKQIRNREVSPQQALLDKDELSETVLKTLAQPDVFLQWR